MQFIDYEIPWPACLRGKKLGGGDKTSNDQTARNEMAPTYKHTTTKVHNFKTAQCQHSTHMRGTPRYEVVSNSFGTSSIYREVLYLSMF